MIYKNEIRMRCLEVAIKATTSSNNFRDTQSLIRTTIVAAADLYNYVMTGENKLK